MEGYGRTRHTGDRAGRRFRNHAASEQAKSEPAYKVELQEERKRREQLERRLNEVVEENKRSRKAADEAERSSAVRAELQRLGVAKVDLAFKAVQDGVRTRRGRPFGGSRRERGSFDEGISRSVRERESGVSAGEDCRGKRNDGDAQGAARWRRERLRWTGFGRE